MYAIAIPEKTNMAPDKRIMLQAIMVNTKQITHYMEEMITKG